jgi:hypothetical protein
MYFIQHTLISSVCLSLLYLTYKLIYRNETNFRHLRFYLMGSVVLSLLVPLNKFTIDLVKSQKPGVVLENLNIPAAPDGQAAAMAVESGLNWTDLALKLYFLIALLLIGRIFLQLFVLAFQYLKSDKIYRKDCVILLNHSFRNTFSFFGWIFIARDSSSDEDLEQIIAHERIHASQYHSVDLIITELLTAVMWFNPLIWKMKNTVQLVHEYLADEGALNTGIDRLRYQALLINQVTEERLICLSSSFNHSLIKKRMKMITNNTLNRRSRIKILTLLPLTATLLLLMAIVNGFFPERLQAGDSEKALASLKTLISDPLLLLNSDLPGDTSKKKTIITIIKKETPGDTIYTETIEVIVAGDTTKTVRTFGHDGQDKIEHADSLIFISEDEDIKRVKGGKQDSIKIVKVIRHDVKSDVKHDEKYDVIHDEKYDVKHDGKKEVVIIREHKPEWTTSDDTPSNTLVIIDGVQHTEKNAMAGLDPDEIIEMSVVKDKTQMKKYTDKEYDGLIIITTKKGKK